MVVSLQSRASAESFKLRVALGGYYFGTGTTQKSTGLLQTISGYRNRQTLLEVKRKFRKLAEQNGYFGDLTLFRTVHVSYRSSMSEIYNRNYDVELVSGATMISNE